MGTDHCVFLVVNVIHMLFESHLKSSGCLSSRLFTAFIAGDQVNNTNCFAILKPTSQDNKSLTFNCVQSFKWETNWEKVGMPGPALTTFSITYIVPFSKTLKSTQNSQVLFPNNALTYLKLEILK